MLPLIISALFFLPIITCRQVSLCPDHEAYDSCGTACPPNCRYSYLGGNLGCIAVCVPGCFCQPGYVRDKEINGTCIPMYECPLSASVCPDNEEYDTCGTACPLNCYNLDDTIECPDVCVTGCFCQDGYVRDKEINGTCIPVTECPLSASVCSENEEYTECGTACPATCLDQEPKVCPDVCVAGCFCKEGYIRSTEEGPCVPKGTCSLYSIHDLLT